MTKLTYYQEINDVFIFIKTEGKLKLKELKFAKCTNKKNAHLARRFRNLNEKKLNNFD